MFCLLCQHVASGIFQIANIVPGLVKLLNTNWQSVSLQHACCSHKNKILNEEIKPRSWPLRFEHAFITWICTLVVGQLTCENIDYISCIYVKYLEYKVMLLCFMSLAHTENHTNYILN